jgi:glycosyltransferase involved in cell wall biosynthesis
MSTPAVAHLCRGREWRGGERQVRLLVTTLAERRHGAQHVLTGRDSRLARNLSGAGAVVVGVPWRVAWDPRALAGIVAALRRLRTAAAGGYVLHAHDSHALAAGVLAARLLDLPLVATRRSDTIPGPLWRQPARVIALSGAVADALRRGGVPDAHIVRIPSAIPPATLAVPPWRNGGEAGTGATIVAVGSLTREKDQATLLRAFARVSRRLPGARLALCGEGPERAPLAQLARALGIADRVRFEGDVADVAAHLRAADVMAQPSRREALGTAVLEAMALGTPVVASATGGLVDLLAGGAGLLVPPGDAAALADALEQALRCAPLRATMVETARARVVSYGAPEVADRVAAVYRSALRTP